MAPTDSQCNRADPFERPLDALLERCRVLDIPYRPDLDSLERWVTRCPVCWRELVLRERFPGAAVALRCAGGCHESRIIASLAAEPPRLDPIGLDLAEAASEIAHRALELLAEAKCP